MRRGARGIIGRLRRLPVTRSPDSPVQVTVRKVWNLGPFRLSLTKSGLGASVGCAGARFGLASGGGPYVSFARGGLYYRRYLFTGRKEQSDD